MRAIALLLVIACSEYDLSATGAAPSSPVDTAVPELDTVTEGPSSTPSTTTTTTTEPVAEAPVYANTTDQLFEVDPATGVRTPIGTFTLNGVPIRSMVDIAIDLSGRMYGGTYDALYQIDPGTAAVSTVCTTDLRPYALAFTSDGLLFAGAGTEVVRFDLQSCSAVPLLEGAFWETSGDLVGLPDGYLYWTVRGESSDELVRVDPVTGATFWLGQISVANLFGLGYHEGQLYGFSSDGVIVQIHPDDATSQILSTDDISWWGATTNPVLWD